MQMSDEMKNFFGENIHIYTRAQALEDGVLVDVSETAREAGFKIPVAVTRAVWDQYIAWTDEDTNNQTIQDEAGRLWDVLWMLMCAIKMRSFRGGSTYL
jgi:type I site-specific restriction endonuclease